MLSGPLLNLLRSHSHDPIVSACLQAIEESEVKHEDTGGLLPLERASNLYSIRAKINSEINDNAIAGFEGLLALLSSAPENAQVRIQSLELLSRWFIIFTDENERVLFGVLDSPKKKAVWFDPIKGYDHE